MNAPEVLDVVLTYRDGSGQWWAQSWCGMAAPEAAAMRRRILDNATSVLPADARDVQVDLAKRAGQPVRLAP